MKGIVFNVLERVVGEAFGEDTWDALVESAGVDGAYTSLGNYDDAELFALVGAASTALDKPAEDIVRWFGQVALPVFAEKYPVFFENHDNTHAFAKTLNDIIHPEVRKLYPGASAPDFEFGENDDGTWTMRYSSEKKLCVFAEGLLEGAAGHFGETIEIKQPVCMNHGADHCQLVIRTAKA